MWLLVFLTFHCKPKNEITVEDVSLEALQESFISPPDSVKPWIYWYWINDNISKEGISRDLEAMASVGIGEALIYNLAVSGVPTGNVPILSEDWLEHMAYAIKEGTRTGVNIGLFNCSGWSQSGGPWITSDKAMRYLSIEDTLIQGPAKFDMTWVSPADFQEVALLAIPQDQQNINQHIISLKSDFQDGHHLFDNQTGTEALYPADLDSAMVEITLDAPKSLRAAVFTPIEQKGFMKGKLLAKDDDQWVKVRGFTIDRHNDRIEVGPKPFAPVAIAFPPITAKNFQLIFYKPENTFGLKEIKLSSVPVLEYFSEKQLAKMYQKNLPDWYAYQWRLQPQADLDSFTVQSSKVIDLSEKVDRNRLQWQVPEGKWKILRIGMVPTGVTNHPALPAAKGLEVDKMNREAVNFHFDSFLGKILAKIKDQERASLKHVVVDSYETGSQNWTDNFQKVFLEIYGYDPIPWLPVLTGAVINSPAQSERFLWDLRRLVADQIVTEYSGQLAKLAHQNGLNLWLQNYGHWGFPTEFLKYGAYADQISGEFWAEGELGSIECRAASSASHIYGKKVISAESYTAAGKHFQRHPASLKKRGDWSFTEGINHVALHLYIQQPWQDTIPGMNAWFGVEFNRHNTYFHQLKGWIDYQRRIMFMLQRGNPVKDVAYFIGEDAPVMTGLLQPTLPVGYDFDYINADVILNRLSVKDGRLVLPEGISYSILVLPPLKTMRPELLQKIERLVARGGKILGPPPQHSPSLQNYPKADTEVAKLAHAMWGDEQQKVIKYQLGLIFNHMNLEEAFAHLGEVPDLKIEQQEKFLYTHRQMVDTDIYFISNQSDEELNAFAEFRVKNKFPQLWNPVTGEIRPLPEYTVKESKVVVPLKFKAAQSWLVVFTAEKPAATNNLRNFPSQSELMDLSEQWQVQFDTAFCGPKQSVSFEELQDWSQHTNDSVKYYSGTAVYSKTFDYTSVDDGRIIFDLGDVNIMAEVFLNGEKVGNVWHKPYQLDVTSYLQQGENHVEIKVVNQWVNRLVGDSRLPVGKRLTYVAVSSYESSSSLLPAGLLGPIKLLKEKY
ncbi:MAG: glycosyl hydrolase [Cyclobacteriaceae bacterium]